MEKYSIKEIIKKIKNYECFEGMAEDGSFKIEIHDYVPLVCAAVHAGHNFRKNLQKEVIHSEYERWYEEDPDTDTFIKSMPLKIIGCDSRFEYDLNRDPKNCVYEDAWGKQVWKKQLSEKLIQESKDKHTGFYKVVDALIESVEKKHKGCLVIDMHSYNYRRHETEQPVFNIGTANVDSQRFSGVIDKWFRALIEIEIRNQESTTEINGPFQGNGYFLKHITKRFKNTLVLATEVKKIYCDELNGDSFPLVIGDLETGFKQAIIDTSSYFISNILGQKKKNEPILASGIDEDLTYGDKELYKLTKTLEVLSYVTPKNLDVEQKKFLSNGGSKNPVFKYNQIVEHPFEFKRKLYSIPLEKIKDITIAKMYRDVVKSYSDKVDMLHTIGEDKFFYNSLRYFGQPNELDLKHAHFILNCPDDYTNERLLEIEEVKKIFEDEISNYGFKANVEITKNVTAEIMVLNYKRKVLLKHGVKLPEDSVKALVHHEIGVHMVTTMNAIEQPLNVFKLGFPTNTFTQEGIAVLTEYLSGHLSIKRLKELALRVVAVDMMVNGSDFKDVYHTLVNKYKMEQEGAFIVATRIFRGGGFTKDFLYLKGFIEILKYYQAGNALDPLLIGKNSIAYVEVFKEMIERKLAIPPKYVTAILKNPKPCSPQVNYVVSGLLARK